MARIHPTAVVDSRSELAADVEVGPLCSVGPEVTIASGVHLASHVVITGRTHIASNTQVFPFAVLGGPAQSRGQHSKSAQLYIGQNCVIREHVTINTGTPAGGMVTRVGDGCLLMIACHVGHDCVIGEHVVLANQVALGGHVSVGAGATIGGMTAVHQHVRIGQRAMIGGTSGVDADVIPFGLAYGNRALLRGLNLRGERRRGVGRAELADLLSAYRHIFGSAEGTLAARVATLDGAARSEHVRELIQFLSEPGRRPLCLPAAS